MRYRVATVKQQQSRTCCTPPLTKITCSSVTYLQPPPVFGFASTLAGYSERAGGCCWVAAISAVTWRGNLCSKPVSVQRANHLAGSQIFSPAKRGEVSVEGARACFQSPSYQRELRSCAYKWQDLTQQYGQANSFASSHVGSLLPDGLCSVILTRNASFPMCDQGKS